MHTSTLQQSTPYEFWIGSKPHLSHLQIFGCSTFAYIPDEKRKKLDAKAQPCIFLGYGDPLGVKGYCLYEPSTKRLFTSRDVIFLEDSLINTNDSPQDSLTTPTFYEISDSCEGPTMVQVPPSDNSQDSSSNQSP